MQLFARDVAINQRFVCGRQPQIDIIAATDKHIGHNRLQFVRRLAVRRNNESMFANYVVGDDVVARKRLNIVLDIAFVDLTL
ncbi:MAG: hypothetical protein HFE46_01160 [Clostridia bacterium]|nr:hypothetical protein [Clostridia bacterium]